MQGNKKENEGKKEIGRWAPDQHQRFMAGTCILFQLLLTMEKTGKKYNKWLGLDPGPK